MEKSRHFCIMSPVVLCLLFLAAGFTASGQHKEKSYYENQVISAVEKYDAQDFAGASDILMDVISSVPDNDAAHYYLGLSAFCQKDFALAEKELKTAIQLDSTNFWYRYRLALVYSATDRKELTISMYEDLLRDFPKKSDLYYSLILIELDYFSEPSACIGVKLHHLVKYSVFDPFKDYQRTVYAFKPEIFYHYPLPP